MSATTIQVSNAAELMQALNTAQSGDVIELASGNYGELTLTAATNTEMLYSGEVVVRSADPDNPAVVAAMEVYGAQNLTFEGITFDYQYQPGDNWQSTNCVEILSSTGVTIRDCVFEGDVMGDPDSEYFGTPTAHGLKVRTCTDVTLEDNAISGFGRGMKIIECDDVLVHGNTLSGQRIDHIVCAEVMDIVIEENHLSNHAPALESGDHRDMIQFWTASTDVPSENVMIRNNMLVLGESNGSAQSIFMGNEAVILDGAGPEMYYQNVTITGNVIVNAHTNGIRGGPYNGLVVSNNTLIYEEVDLPTTMPPRIAIHEDSTNVTIIDNVTPEIVEHPGWTIAGNLLTDMVDTGNPAHYQNLFINSGAGTLSDLPNLQSLPGSLVETLGVGAPMLLYNSTPDALTALVSANRDVDDWSVFSFDAGFTANGEGQLGDTAVYLWDFGDGNMASGLEVSHGYAAPGTYTVTLTVLHADGSSDTTTTRVEVRQPLVLSLNETGSSFVAHDMAEVTEVAISDTQTGGTATAAGLVFADAATAYVLDSDHIAPLAGAGEFRIDLSILGADWSQDSGEVARVQGAFRLAINDSGTLTVSVTPDGQPTTWVTTNLALTEGDWSDVSLRFDGDAGTVEVWINGSLAGQGVASGALALDLSSDLKFGEVFGIGSFVGEIRSFEIHAEESLHGGLETGGMPDPVSFVLRSAYDSDTGILQLFGATVDGDAPALLTLTGNGSYAVISDTPDVASGEILTISFDFRRAEADGEQARLLWNHRKLGVEAMEDGLAVSVLNADGVFQRILIDDLGLNDTDWHQVVIHVDETADLLLVSVDDALVFVELGIDIVLDDPYRTKEYDWHIGGAWNGYFEGEIGDVEIADHYPDEINVADVLGWVPDDPDSIIFL